MTKLLVEFGSELQIARLEIHAYTLSSDEHDAILKELQARESFEFSHIDADSIQGKFNGEYYAILEIASELQKEGWSWNE